MSQYIDLTEGEGHTTYHTFTGLTLKLPLLPILKCQGCIWVVTARTFVTVGTTIIISGISGAITLSLVANSDAFLKVNVLFMLTLKAPMQYV